MHPKANYIVYKINQEKHKRMLAKQAKATYLEHLSAKLIKADFKYQFRNFIIALTAFFGLMFLIL